MAQIVLQPDDTTGMDAYVISSSTSSYNNDSLSVRYVEDEMGKVYDFSFIQFNISSIPVGSMITSAILSLYCTTYDVSITDQSATNNVKATLITSSWTESIKYSAMPTLDANTIVVITVTADNQWFNWDITSIAQSWMSGTANYGLRISSATDSGSMSYYNKVFASSGNTDSTIRPKLTITYIENVEAPTLISITQVGNDIQWTWS